MATVYLAHDIRHDRSVAIKVLRSDIAQTIGADRFLREIQLAARLNHPNMVALIGDEKAANRLVREAAARRDPGIPVFCRLAGEVPAMSKLPAYQELLRALSLPGL